MPDNTSEKLLAGKYKSVEELEKGYQETSGEASRMAEDIKAKEEALKKVETELKEAQELVNVVQPAVNWMTSQPEIVDQYRIATGQAPLNPQKKDDKEPPAKKNEEVEDLKQKQKAVEQELASVRSMQRQQIIAEFEKRHGFNEMEKEQATKSRAAIGTIAQKFTRQDMQKLSPSRLNDVLEDAWTVHSAEQLKETGKLEGYAESRKREGARIVGAPSGSAKKDDTPSLSFEEREVAENAGVSVEDYAKAKQKITAGDYTSKD